MAEPSGTDPVDPDIGQLGYAQAMDELESILAELEADDIDVDHLAVRVARAAALIELCRGRVESARVDVTRIVKDLE